MTRLALAAGLVLTLAAAASPGGLAQTTRTVPTGDRARFLDMFARGYFPGRTGQLMVVPRQGVVLTRNEPTATHMHGSPWPYDTRIPMFFAGRQVRTGTYNGPARHQDIAPTLAAVLGTSMPGAVTGRPLPILAPAAPRPRAIALVVLDGMRVDYFDRYASDMPTLARLRKSSAWMTTARIDYLPTNTAVGHTTIATGTDPRVHGITGNNLYDRVKKTRKDSYAGWNPADLMALTLADVWQLEQGGKPVVIALGAGLPAATALAGHGACQLNGVPTTLAGYSTQNGRWQTNRTCYAPIDRLNDMVARALWPSDGTWMGHKINTPSAVRYSGLFSRFEADALIRLIDSSPIGDDGVADLVLFNYKTADYVGHMFGPSSGELRAALGELDRNLARVLEALDKKLGRDYLLAVTADHGMPDTPKAPRDRQFNVDIVERLHSRFDPKMKTLIPYYEPENAQIFVDMDRLAALKLTLRSLADYLQSEPYMFAVFTEEEVRR
jgi:predicted AlkP superfamily pyrophosphatase or phosphodiesterase